MGIKDIGSNEVAKIITTELLADYIGKARDTRAFEESLVLEITGDQNMSFKEKLKEFKKISRDIEKIQEGKLNATIELIKK